MEKLLFTTFLTFLAGFVAAVMSLVNLINEKERKISEYRKEWVQSLRECLSDVAGKMASLSAVFEDRADYLSLEERDPKNVIWKERLASVEKDINDQRHDLYRFWAMTRLHFKPDELEVYQIEQKYKTVIDLLNRMGEPASTNYSELREKVNAEVNEFVNASRFLLKREWEVVKRGEPAYVKTKRYSIWAGAFMFFLLLTIGIHAFIASLKEPTPASGSDHAVVGDQTKVVNAEVEKCKPAEQQPDRCELPPQMQLINSVNLNPATSSLEHQNVIGKSNHNDPHYNENNKNTKPHAAEGCSIK